LRISFEDVHEEEGVLAAYVEDDDLDLLVVDEEAAEDVGEHVALAAACEGEDSEVVADEGVEVDVERDLLRRGLKHLYGAQPGVLPGVAAGALDGVSQAFQDATVVHLPDEVPA